MPHLVSEKFNVAWFKLAEFVQRKEKERALALYRLLVHSVLDSALMMQLEGDLLLAFKDEKALEVYKRAATMYEESGRYLEAVLLYEHCSKLASPSVMIFEKMQMLYDKLGYEAHKVRCEVHLARLLYGQQNHDMHAYDAQKTLEQ